jgi:hypothetical protein
MGHFAIASGQHATPEDGDEKLVVTGYAESYCIGPVSEIV